MPRRFEVEYGAADKVTIRIDNGTDGSIDRAVVTKIARRLTVK